jgi:hypothetical protein
MAPVPLGVEASRVTSLPQATLGDKEGDEQQRRDAEGHRCILLRSV